MLFHQFNDVLCRPGKLNVQAGDMFLANLRGEEIFREFFGIGVLPSPTLLDTPGTDSGRTLERRSFEWVSLKRIGTRRSNKEEDLR